MSVYCIWEKPSMKGWWKKRKCHKAALRSAFFMTALLTAAIGGKAYGQAAAPPRKNLPIVYDVVTIKVSKTLDGGLHYEGTPVMFRTTNVKLKMLLANAFDIRESYISGLPEWAESARYDVIAKASEADPVALKAQTVDEDNAMLQQLLEDRFQLKWHIEVKTLPVFDMRVVSSGMKFKAFVPRDEFDKGDSGLHGSGHNLMFSSRGTTMPDFAHYLSATVQRTVIDKTGLRGKYDVQLNWLRDDAPAGGDDAAPIIFTALQEQLGLRLKSSKGPVNTLVIDSVSQPLEN